MGEDWIIFRQKRDYTLFRFFLDERVPALLLKPRHIPPPYPALFFLHHYRGSKESIVFSASEIARRGFLALAIDMEYHGERKREGRDILSPDLEDDRRATQRTVEDCLVALDFLEHFGEVQEEKMFLLGVSLGALLGCMVCALYGRFRSAAFVVGGGNIETLFRESMLDSIVEIRFDLAKKGLPIPEAVRIFQDLDPLNLAKDLKSILFTLSTPPRTVLFPLNALLTFMNAFGLKRAFSGSTPSTTSSTSLSTKCRDLSLRASVVNRN